MIYVLTLNPSIDYYLSVDDFKLNTINRATSTHTILGGKGINVYRKLKELGVHATLMIALGGNRGKQILSDLDLGARVIFTNGESRINVKINSSGETAINTPSPALQEAEIAQLISLIRSISSGDIIVINGNLKDVITPPDLHKALALIEELGGRTILDISDPNFLFDDVTPLLIKPNIDELVLLSGIKIDDEASFLKAIELLLETKARNILVSLGGKGAIFCNKLERVFIPSKELDIINTVGAGDNLLAAFIKSKFIDEFKTKEALEFALEETANYLIKINQ